MSKYITYIKIILEPLPNLKNNKVLRIRNGICEGSSINEKNDIIWKKQPLQYPIPYNTVVYPSYNISPIFCGRSFVKSVYSKEKINNNPEQIHPSFSGYLYPPLNVPPCLCRKIDEKPPNDTINGLCFVNCFHSNTKPIFNYEKRNDIIKDNISKINSNLKLNKIDINDKSTSISDADKYILSKYLSEFKDLIDKKILDESLNIKPVENNEKKEPLLLYEMIDIDYSNSNSAFRDYSSILTPLLLSPDDFNTIKHLNYSELAKLEEMNNDNEFQFSCNRCEYSFHGYDELIHHICYECQYNIYPCNITNNCNNLISYNYYCDHRNSSHKSYKPIDNDEKINIQNVEIEIIKNNIKENGIIKSYIPNKNLHEIEINGIIEEICLINYEYNIVKLMPDKLDSEFNSYIKYIKEKNLTEMKHYMSIHKFEINNKVHVIINNKLYKGDLIGLDPERKIFKVIVHNKECDISIGYIFSTTEHKRINRNRALLSRIEVVDDTESDDEVKSPSESKSESEQNDNNYHLNDIGALSLIKNKYTLLDDDDEPHNSESSSSETEPIILYDTSEFEDKRNKYKTAHLIPLSNLRNESYYKKDREIKKRRRGRPKRINN